MTNDEMITSPVELQPAPPKRRPEFSIPRGCIPIEITADIIEE
jgi:hypothetical protein